MRAFDVSMKYKNGNLELLQMVPVSKNETGIFQKKLKYRRWFRSSDL